MSLKYVTKGDYCGDINTTECIGFAESYCPGETIPISARLMWQSVLGETYNIYISGTAWLTPDSKDDFDLAIKGILFISFYFILFYVTNKCLI